MRPYSFILLLVVLLYGCAKTEAPKEKGHAIEQNLSHKNSYRAGEQIVLEFSKKPNANSLLHIRYGWGTSLLQPDTLDTSKFVLPKYISEKSGDVQWFLLSNDTIVDLGNIHILPSDLLTENMETYLGPTSIFADGFDRSMYVSLPQDVYGNPLSSGTKITSKTQLNNRNEVSEIEVRNGIAYKYLEGGSKVGNLFLSSYLGNQVSKEFTVEIWPTKAAEFLISAKQEHKYADGNQVFNMLTSKILDVNGNDISDGTLVKFVAQDSNGQILVAYGQTLDGHAIGKFLHPEEPATWNIQALISGVAQSNAINVEFMSAFEDFPVHLNRSKDSIQIGPIKSYMKQLIPDGLSVEMKVIANEGVDLYSAKSNTRKGIAMIEIPSEFRKEDLSVQISAGGITKTTKPF